MRAVACAPGKLVITGEYAVLEGAPALVLAIDREARVELDDSAEPGYEITAPTLGIRAAHGELDASGRMAWPALDAPTIGQLALVSAVLETLATEGAPAPFRARLDTRAFHAAADGHAKLGLGSSAALTVALARAVCAREERGAPGLATLIAAHRRAQGGRGSGLDIAASLIGGLLVYRLDDGQPRVSPATWPAGLEWCCVWSGKSASTGAYLGQLAAWRVSASARYAALMRELGDCARAAASAADAATLIETVAAYALALDRLGHASGLDIISAEHRTLGELATRHGVTYKTCGAGGGDIGIALATDAERLQAFGRAAATSGFTLLDLHPSPGARLQSSTISKEQQWTSHT
jgi:phosphomevalonate kinase